MEWGTPWRIQRERYRHPKGDSWFPWFAWHPVRTEMPHDKWIWLEWVEKRYPDGMKFNLPDYRLIPPKTE